jgi:hypothetical protein
MEKMATQVRSYSSPGWIVGHSEVMWQSGLSNHVQIRIHGRKVLNRVSQAELPVLISIVAADAHRFTTCNPSTHNESHSDRANLATGSIVKQHKANTWASRRGPC